MPTIAINDLTRSLDHARSGLGEPDSLVGFDSAGEVGIIAIEKMDMVTGGGEKCRMDGIVLIYYTGARSVMFARNKGEAIPVSAED